MGFQIVRGSSGSGKSTYLIKAVIDKSIQNKEDNFIFVVPEQFTLETQRKVVLEHPNHAIMNIDILSFDRLAYRVFEEQCVKMKTVLDDCGKLLLLRRVCEDNKDKLVYYNRNVSYIGFIEQVKSLVSELLQYDISLDDIDNICKNSSINGILDLKLRDIRLIFSEYKKALGEEYISGEDILKNLCRYIEVSKLISRSTFVFDEFTGFTPIQLKVMELLMIYAKEVIVSVTLDSTENYKNISKHELFYLSKNTIVTLLNIADRAQVEIKEDYILDDAKPYRFASGEICYLEKNIFKTSISAYEQEVKDISIYEAFNPHSEIDYVIYNIKQLIKIGYRYKDIALVSGDAKELSTYISKKFEFNGIPTFVDDKKAVINNPLINLIRSAIIICRENFSYESVFRFLKTGLSNLEEDEIDLLENYILATGIKGKSSYKKPFVKLFKTYDERYKDLTHINSIKDRFYECFEPLCAALTSKKSKVKDYVQAIICYLESVDAKNKLQDLGEKLNDEFLRKEMVSIYALVLDMFDKITALIGDDKLDLETFAGILDTGIEQIKISIIPPVTDSVLVGDIVRTRLNDIKILFFIGINEGIIPQKSDGTNLLTEFDREQITKNDIILAPSSKEEMFIQNFYLYLNMTKPSHRLYMSYRKFDLDGKSIMKSYLIGNIQKMFPKLVIKRDTDYPDLTNYLKVTNSRYNQTIKEVTRLDKDCVDDLYGDELYGSISRIENFMACSFAHFLKYGLKLSEREVYEISDSDVGNIVHEALRVITQRMKKSGQDFTNISEEERYKLCHDVVYDIGQKYENNIMSATNRSLFRLECLVDIVDRSVWAISHQLQGGTYSVWGSEKSFDSEKSSDDMMIKLSHGKHMEITGRIDRIDTFEDDDNRYIKIVDYKTGNRDFLFEDVYYGLSLQLLVYMKAALNMGDNDKKSVPAAMFYNHLDNPIVEVAGGDNSAEEAILKELMPRGVIVENIEVAKTLDKNIAPSYKSNIVNIALTKEGLFQKTNKVLPEDVIEYLPEYAMGKIKAAAADIIDGKIDANPYKKDKKTSCSYCPYSKICSFDISDGKSKYRRIKEMKKEEFIDAIRNSKNENLKKGEE